jgi:hypothetical protein
MCFLPYLVFYSFSQIAIVQYLTLHLQLARLCEKHDIFYTVTDAIASLDVGCLRCAEEWHVACLVFLEVLWGSSWPRLGG